MENATKALLIAGGILIAIIIIWVMVTLFQNTGRTSESYNKRLSAEEIEIFNSNFTKYLGQNLTIHEVITITNFANSNNVKVNNPKGTNNVIANEIRKEKYRISINKYNDTGYISEITITG